MEEAEKDIEGSKVCAPRDLSHSRRVVRAVEPPIPTLAPNNDGGSVDSVDVAVHSGSAITLLVVETLVINVGSHTKFTVTDGATATPLPRLRCPVERRRRRPEARAFS